MRERSSSSRAVSRRGRRPARRVGTSVPVRRLLRGLRVLWVVAAGLALGFNAAGIPRSLARYEKVCRGPGCGNTMGELTPEYVRELHEVGLPVGYYAAYFVGIGLVATLVSVGVAAVIFWRRSGDGMALFTSFTLLVFGGFVLAGTPDALAGSVPALWLPVHLLDYAGQVLFGVFFYVFPNGRFTPRWTLLLALVAAVLWVPNVFFPGSPLNLMSGPLFAVYIGTLVGAQVYRYRRVSGPTERQQTKWVVFSMAVGLLGFVAVITLGNLFPALKRTGPVGEMAANGVIAVCLTFVPLGILVAILRSRLYEIDAIINRALVYGALSVSLAVTYLAGVALLQRILTPLLGQSSQLSVVVSTLAIAALFNPLRKRIQSFIDRRFYRRKYDVRQTLQTFSGKVRARTDLAALTDDLVSVVRETMQPEHVSLWLEEPGGRSGFREGDG